MELEAGDRGSGTGVRDPETHLHRCFFPGTIPYPRVSGGGANFESMSHLCYGGEAWTLS